MCTLSFHQALLASPRHRSRNECGIFFISHLKSTKFAEHMKCESFLAVWSIWCVELVSNVHQGVSPEHCGKSI